MNTLRTRRLAALAVVGALALASCSSGGDDAAEKTTTTKAEKTTTTEKATTTTTTEATTTTDGTVDTLDELEQVAKDALLTAKEVAPDFTEDTYEGGTSTGPCTDTHPDELIKPAVHVGAASGRQDAGYEQAIRIYDDEAEGKEAFANFKESISCDGGTITKDDGSTSEVTLGDEVDMAGINKHIDEGYARQASTTGAKGYVVVTRLGASVITFQFFSAEGTDDSTLPDIPTVISKAMDKAAAA